MIQIRRALHRIHNPPLPSSSQALVNISCNMLQIKHQLLVIPNLFSNCKRIASCQSDLKFIFVSSGEQEGDGFRSLTYSKFAPLIQQNQKSKQSEMQSTQNRQRVSLMTASLLLSQEKLHKSPQKKAFSPIRPLYQLFLTKHQGKLASLKNYKSTLQLPSMPESLNVQTDLAPSLNKIDSNQGGVESESKFESNKIKLLRIKEKYQKEGLEAFKGVGFKDPKKSAFEKKNVNLSFIKDVEDVLHNKKPAWIGIKHQKSEKKDRNSSREIKILNINNQRQFFQIVKFIDEGSYGKVHLVQHVKTQMLFCLKTIVKSQLDEQSFNQLIREIKIQSYLSFMNHPNIVSLYSFTADAENVYLLLEACPGQNLFKRLKSHPIKQKDVRKYIKDVCVAIDLMHRHDIIHRDIKPENVIIHENTIKICDFGWAVHSPLLRNTKSGTPLYTPPEMVKDEYYDSKIDIWCIGVLTYEVLYGTIPFQIRHPNDLSKIVSEKVYFSKEVNVSNEAKHFIQKCLEKNAHERYNIRQALQDDFLTTKMETCYRHTMS